MEGAGDGHHSPVVSIRGFLTLGSNNGSGDFLSEINHDVPATDNTEDNKNLNKLIEPPQQWQVES